MKKRFNYPAFIIIILVTLAVLFPIYWIIATSLKTGNQAFQIPPAWFFNPTMDNYKNVLGASDAIGARDLTVNLLNSVIVTFGATFLSLVFGLPAAYALARFNFKRKDNLSFWILSLRMMPPIAAVIPIYYLASRIKLLGSYYIIILIYLIFSLPFVIWLMRGFFNDLPVAIEEAARVDGATRIQVFFKIALPLSLPAIAATTILTWIFAWNEFLFAVILSNKNTATVPVGIMSFMTMYNVYWNNMAAAAVVAFLPVVILSLFVGRYIVRGMTLGSVKY
jgi:multiple sugar transport system permease protein